VALETNNLAEYKFRHSDFIDYGMVIAFVAISAFALMPDVVTNMSPLLSRLADAMMNSIR